MARDSALISEIKDNISGGNKIIAVVAAALIVWWASNLIPVSVSGDFDETPTVRIRQIGQALIASEGACQELRYYTAGARQDANCLGLFVDEGLPITSKDAKNFLATTRDDIRTALNGRPEPKAETATPETTGKALNGRPEPPLRSATLEAAPRALKDAPKQISDEKCRKVATEFVSKFGACENALNKLDDDEKKLRDGAGDLELLGLKFKRIHPRLHPAVFCGIVLTAALWIGNRRRRTFRYIDEYVEARNNRIRIGGQQAGKPDGELLFLFIPWWLYPFRAERALIDGTVIVGRRELRDAAVRLFLAILALAVGLGSALYFQRVLSEVSVLSGAKVETTPYSLTHTYIGDLSLLGLMGGLAALLYLWPLWRSAPSSVVWSRQHRRRAFIKGAATGAVVLVGGAILAPVATDWRTVGRGQNAVGSELRLQPRQRRRKVMVRAPAEGWYKVAGPSRKRVLHYARNAITVVRVDRWPPKRKQHSKRQSTDKRRASQAKKATQGFTGTLVRMLRPRRKTIRLPVGTILGAGKLAPRRLEALQFQAIETQPLRLNKQFYSEGIENTVVRFWGAGRREEALQVLALGLRQADLRRTKHKLNMRLYDLAAALFVVEARFDRLIELGSRLEGVLQSSKRLSESDRKLVALRISKWQSRNSRWFRKWREAGARWNNLRLSS